jgi:very-short-patch-repair endonuclease
MEKPRRIRTSRQVLLQARELRKHQTSAEECLWEHLRDRRLNGFKFRRQCPLGPYIADFYCAAFRVIVEIDGDIHKYQKDQDDDRTAQFEAYGYHVIRFKNQDVLEKTDWVLKSIATFCHKVAPKSEGKPSSSP